MKDEKIYRVGILLYEGMDIQTAAGPADVFSSAAGFTVRSIGLSNSVVTASCGITLIPDHTQHNHSPLDVLVIPGGKPEQLPLQQELLRWLQAMSIKTTVLLSVCNGILLLAAAGLLDGRTFTCPRKQSDKLQRMVPTGKIIHDHTCVDSGNIITTAGLLAGIEGALYTIKLLKGSTAAQQVAAQLEYAPWMAA